MPGNRDPILKTIETSLTENELKHFNNSTCPNCKTKKAIEYYFYPEFEHHFNIHTLEAFSICNKCDQKYTHYFKETDVTHYITFNEKGQKVYTCQEKTLRTANTKKIEPNSNKEESNT